MLISERQHGSVLGAELGAPLGIELIFGQPNSSFVAHLGSKIQILVPFRVRVYNMFLIFWIPASPEASDEGRCIPTMGKLQQGC